MPSRRSWRRWRTRAARREHAADFYARIAPGATVRPEWGVLALRPWNGRTWGSVQWGKGRDALRYRTQSLPSHLWFV